MSHFILQNLSVSLSCVYECEQAFEMCFTSFLHFASSDYSSRSTNLICLIIPKARTVFGRNAFRFAAALDWNTLQNTLKLTIVIPLTTFKHKLQQIVVDSCTC